MAAVLEPVELTAREAEIAAAPGVSAADAALPSSTAGAWIRAQSVNLTRHAAALRPFRRDEFGSAAASPTEGHLQAVNHLISALRRTLLRLSKHVGGLAEAAQQEPDSARLEKLVRGKDQSHNWVRAIERIWDFYFELFGQRQSRYADWLLSCDRIALDCYQNAYMGLGKARSIPAPPPFSFMRTGFSPATIGRGVPMRKLGRQLNPFPLIQLPYHRLVNPWTLGAVLHEVSHNLQNDLGLAKPIPRNIARRLLREGFPPSVAATWTRWNRELFADLSGLLLGGPAIVASLMDVVGRAPGVVLTYDSRGVHPTPYLRTFLSIELLRRMGFPREAESYEALWTAIYPNPGAGNFPPALLQNFRDAVSVVVDASCFQPYPSLGNKSLAQVMRFEPKEQTVLEEAARRLAVGNDPGIIPERFLIGAARIAFDRRYARPGVITRNFYRELARR